MGHYCLLGDTITLYILQSKDIGRVGVSPALECVRFENHCLNSYNHPSYSFLLFSCR